MTDEAEAGRTGPKPRYGIYFVPAPEARLWAFGSSVLGYDAIRERDVEFPVRAIDGLDWEALTREPRLYGFHGTLKAPFELADGAREAELLAAVQSFAAARPALPGMQIEVRGLERFVALVPVSRSASLHELADECVRAFDRFRAPLGEADRLRRLKSPLSERQMRYLDEWGYPYVLEEFRFHMTLTGPLAAGDLERVRSHLASRYAEIAAPLVVDAIAVAIQPARGAPFRVLQRFPLLG